MNDRDQVMDELGDLVVHLMAKRDAGSKEARTLGEQARFRDGINVALRAVASVRLNLSMGAPAE